MHGIHDGYKPRGGSNADRGSGTAHSRLTTCARIFQTVGECTSVWTAGKLICVSDGILRAINDKTGHFFDFTDDFAGVVKSGTMHFLEKFGYDVSKDGLSAVLADASWILIKHR